MKNYYKNICFKILKEYNKNINIFKGNNIKLDIYENKINKIEINKKILEKCKQNGSFQNSHCNREHKKSNSIIINKIISSNIKGTKELQKNNSNSNLSYLISKNLKFFSKEKDDKNEKRPELYRDSKSLQKKYEQICRRKKRQLTMTFTTRFKDNNLNKVNSFPNLDKKIAISFQLKNSKNLNQIFNLNEKNIEKKNYTEKKNKKDKDIYKIKLIKGNFNDKKIISYRIEKTLLKNKESNNIIKEKTFTLKSLPKEFSFNSHCNKLEHPFKESNNNHKKFIYKRKNYIRRKRQKKRNIL